MQFNILVILTTMGLVASVAAQGCSTQRSYSADCCWQNSGACKKKNGGTSGSARCAGGFEDGKPIQASEPMCAANVQATCDADCCSVSKGVGIP